MDGILHAGGHNHLLQVEDLTWSGVAKEVVFLEFCLYDMLNPDSICSIPP